MLVQNIYSCGKWLRIKRILETPITLKSDQARLAIGGETVTCHVLKHSPLSGSWNNSRDKIVYLENAGKRSSSRSGDGRKITICFYTLIWRVRQNTCGNSTRCGSQTPKIWFCKTKKIKGNWDEQRHSKQTKLSESFLDR